MGSKADLQANNAKLGNILSTTRNLPTQQELVAEAIALERNFKPENIRNGVVIFETLGTAPRTTIDGVESNESLSLMSAEIDLRYPTCPKNMTNATSMLLYNDKIYVLGGTTSAGMEVYSLTNHETGWVSEPAPPNQIYYTACIVYNGKIHVIGGATSSSYTQHKTFDGTTWGDDVATPVNFASGNVCVCNNKIHILGHNQSSGSYQHYSFDGSKWTSETNAPYSFSTNYGSNHLCVFNNEIHLFGSGGDYKTHYRYDSTNKQWYSVDLAPYGAQNISVCFDGEKVHLLGGGSGTAATGVYHYTYKDGVYTREKDLPISLYGGNSLLKNGNILICFNNDLFELNVTAYLKE